MSEEWQIAVRERGAKVREERKSSLYASLNRRGEIALSAEAFRAIKAPWNVTLLFREAGEPVVSSQQSAVSPTTPSLRGAIGVKCPVPGDKEFFPVRRYGRGGRIRVIGAKRMLRQFGITVTDTLVFRDIKMEFFGKEPMLVLELDQAERREPPRRRNAATPPS